MWLSVSVLVTLTSSLPAKGSNGLGSIRSSKLYGKLRYYRLCTHLRLKRWYTKSKSANNITTKEPLAISMYFNGISVKTLECGSTSLDVWVPWVCFVVFTDVASRLSVCFPSGVFERSLDSKLCLFVLLSCLVVVRVAWDSVGSVVKSGPFVEVRLCSSDHHVNCWDDKGEKNSKSAFDWTLCYLNIIKFNLKFKKAKLTSVASLRSWLFER